MNHIAIKFVVLLLTWYLQDEVGPQGPTHVPHDTTMYFPLGSTIKDCEENWLPPATAGLAAQGFDPSKVILFGHLCFEQTLLPSSNG